MVSSIKRVAIAFRVPSVAIIKFSYLQPGCSVCPSNLFEQL